MKDTRGKYVAHIAKILDPRRRRRCRGKADRIMALETKIAQAFGTRADSADVQKGQQQLDPGRLRDQGPGLDRSAFFTAAGLADQPRFIVWHPTMVTGLGKVTAEESLDTWKDYLTFHLLDLTIRTCCSRPSSTSVSPSTGAGLQGTPQLAACWKRGVNSTNAVLGEAVGQA